MTDEETAAADSAELERRLAVQEFGFSGRLGLREEDP
jgi:hypothetical protein